MRFSNSSISSILSCPMTYHLRYDLGINPIVKPQALDLGSAIHWGIERNTYDLEEYYQTESTRKYLQSKADECALGEVIVKTYLDNEDEILKDLLKDVNVIDRFHEVEITVKLNSVYRDENEFLGIIDYLLYTDKGFIIIDFKSSSKIPEYSKYLQQLYCYCMLMKEYFPEVPIYKIAVVNFVKSSTKRKPNETIESFKRRLFIEYENNDNLINVQTYNRDLILDERIEQFKHNLENQCDICRNLIEFCKFNNCYYINYESMNMYGGSPYKPLLTKEKNCYVMYNVKDKWIEDDKIVNSRSMTQLDIDSIYDNKIVCRYNKFVEINEELLKNNKDLSIIESNMLNLGYIFNENSVKTYYEIYKKGDISEKR